MTSAQRETKYCKNCGEEVDVKAEICPKCGVRVEPFTPKVRKNVGLASVLSVVWVGLGQIYNEQIGKGIALMIAQFFLIIIAVLTLGLLFFLPLVLWIWNIYDAYKTAKRINIGETEI